jgi:hypothetical protein
MAHYHGTALHDGDKWRPVVWRFDDGEEAGLIVYHGDDAHRLHGEATRAALAWIATRPEVQQEAWHWCKRISAKEEA